MEKKTLKRLLSFLLIGVCLLTLSACSSTKKEERSERTETKEQMQDSNNSTIDTEKKIEVPSSASSYIGENYQTVLSELQKAGFSNIELNELEDLTSSSDTADGAVESVSIDGSNFFEKKDSFPPDASVVITYHIIPKLLIPIGSGEIQTASYGEIEEAFLAAGFVTVTATEVYDLDPDEVMDAFINEVLINGKKNFNKNDQTPFDSEIVIVGHYPYEKYTLKLNIDFVPNLFFNKYDVDVLVNNEKQDRMEHGKDGDFEYRLKEGSYVLTFASADSSSVKGEVNLDIDCDIDAAYQIWCYRDYITVDEQYVDHKRQLSDNEAKIMGTEQSFTGKNYKTVLDELKGLGFINIEAVPVYDIYLGFTEKESVSDVSIGGKDDYKRGDIYQKDVRIIVTYHMPYQEDPTRPTPTPTPISTQSPTPTPKPTTPPVSTPKPNKNTASYHSSNNRDTAKKGNSGVYAYEDTRGTYVSYYIIDFDEGYVYYFSEGNGNAICDRVKMVQGDLNDVLIITYHDGGTKWSYGLHFKWKNQPDILILQDESGYEVEHYPTNLDDALKIRDTKTIIDY